MTKFILAGGNDKRIAGGEDFYGELLAGFEGPVRMLQCLFARDTSEWNDVYLSDVDFIASNFPQRIEPQISSPDEFEAQLDWAQVIFFRGGSTTKLIEMLARYPRWREQVSGKTVAGSSAGANMLSKYYYGLHGLDVREGLGLVPVKVLVHYRSDFNAPNIDWDKAEAELRAYGEELPFIPLVEGGYKVIEQ